MSGSSAEQESDRQTRLERILAEYLHSVEQGQPLDRQALLAAHPDLANDLQSFFRNRESIDRMAEPLKAAIDAPTLLGTSDIAESTPGKSVRYFGDYELLDEIARGGMGVVYKARQVNLNRTVALKMILAGQLANDADVKRFYAEAEAAARLDHPGIVPIFEIGQHEGQHYFSMAFVEGESLAKKVANGPLPAREAAQQVQKVAEAVQYAHEHDIIHRDLKPANVLLDGQGQCKVTDFGLAKQMKGDSGLTGTGQILGTPSYMPPEQAAGKIDDIGPAADVYSLGAILYCLLTGRPPFQAANPMDTLLQVLDQEPATPRQLNPQVPLDLETIALKCLEKPASRRYGSARELADELRRFLEGEPIHARPVSTIERGWRWCRRKPVVAGLGVSSIALVIAVAVVATVAYWREAGLRTTIENRNSEIKEALEAETVQHARADDKAAEAERRKEEAQANAVLAEKRREEADNQRLEADKQRALAVAREATVSRLLYASRMNLALRSWQDTKIAEVLDYLKSQIPENGQTDLRGPEWHLLWRLCHADLQTVPLRPGLDDEQINQTLPLMMGLYGKGLSADGRQLAVSDGINNRVFIMDCQTGRPTATLPGLLAQDDESEKGARIPLKKISAVLPLPGDRVAISAEKSTLSTGNKLTVENDVTVRDTKTNQIIWKLTAHNDTVSALALGGDDKYLVTASAGKQAIFTVWDLSSGKPLQTVTETDAKGSVGIVRCALNPAGDRLAGAVSGRRVTVWELPGARPLYTTDEFPIGVAGITFSPNGNHMAVAAHDGTVSLRKASTGELEHLCRAQAAESGGMYGGPPLPLSVAFCPDSRRMAVGTRDATVQLWDVESGHLQRTYKGHTTWIAAVAWLPDEQILSVSADGTTKVWPADGGDETIALRRHAMQISAIAFSPDGAWLASGSLAGKGANLMLWNATTGEFVRHLGGHGAKIEALAFSPDGRRLASSGLDKTVNIQDPATGQLIKTLRDFKQDVNDLSFLSDGKKLLTRSTIEVRIWDLETGLAVGKPVQVAMHANAVSADGNWLASVNYGATAPAGGGRPISISVRDLREEDAVRELTYVAADSAVPTQLGLSRDGSLLAEARSNGTMAVWNVGINKVETIWKCKIPLLSPFTARAVTPITFSPDGRRLATSSSEGKLRLWDVASGQEVYALAPGSGDAQGLDQLAALKYGSGSQLIFAAFSPASDRIAAGSANSILLWNVAPVTTGPDHRPAQPPVPAAAQPITAALERSADEQRRDQEIRPIQQQLKTIGLAFQRRANESPNQCFPAGYSDQDGKLILSWRVALLPALGETALFAQFHLDEPWDSEHNRTLIPRIPTVYQPVRREAIEGQTYYRGFSGEQAMFPAKSLTVEKVRVGERECFPVYCRPVQTILDGTATTLLVAEAGEPVVWTKPEDLPYDPAQPLPKLGDKFGGDFNAVSCAGITTLFPRTLPEKSLRAGITPAGGEYDQEFQAVCFSPNPAQPIELDNLRKVAARQGYWLPVGQGVTIKKAYGIVERLPVRELGLLVALNDTEHVIKQLVPATRREYLPDGWVLGERTIDGYSVLHVNDPFTGAQELYYLAEDVSLVVTSKSFQNDALDKLILKYRRP